jgi:hypothetical protein
MKRNGRLVPEERHVRPNTRSPSNLTAAPPSATKKPLASLWREAEHLDLRELLSPDSSSYLGDVATRATNRATKLRELSRTDSASKRLNKPGAPAHTSFRRYRTQEVAGSSPASSM